MELSIMPDGILLSSPCVGARSRLRSSLSPASLTARYAATLQPPLLLAALTLLFAAGAFTGSASTLNNWHRSTCK